MTYNLYVDEKISIWNRTYYRNVEANSLEEAVKKCIDGEVDFYNSELIHETEERISPKDNSSNATIEAYISTDSYKDKLVYSNKLKEQ